MQHKRQITIRAIRARLTRVRQEADALAQYGASAEARQAGMAARDLTGRATFLLEELDNLGAARAVEQARAQLLPFVSVEHADSAPSRPHGRARDAGATTRRQLTLDEFNAWLLESDVDAIDVQLRRVRRLSATAAKEHLIALLELLKASRQLKTPTASEPDPLQP